VLCYVLQVSEYVERDALKALLAREIGPEIEEAIVTDGQRLIEQGRQQGLEQGRQQGLEQGRQRLQELLLQLLRQRFWRTGRSRRAARCGGVHRAGRHLGPAGRIGSHARRAVR
jgi:hypothetical protein